MKLQAILNETVELFNKPAGIDWVIDTLINKLGIENANIKISFNPKNITFYDNQTGVAVQSVKDRNLFYVFIKPNLSQVELLTTLTHELFHVKQMVSGDLYMTLEPKGYHVIWKNEDYGVIKYNKQAPWEVEAVANERKYLTDLTQKT